MAMTQQSSVLLDTLEGLLDDDFWYHYDASADVLYLRRKEERETHTIGDGDDGEDGLILLLDDLTRDPVGLTVVDWWKRFGKGDLPDSITEILNHIRPLTDRIPPRQQRKVDVIPKDAKRILLLLVESLSGIEPGNAKTYLGYKEVHDLLNLPRRGHTWGQSLQQYGLNELATWVRDQRLPAVTGVIADRSAGLPGHGYFEIYGRPQGDEEWWHQQVRESKLRDWRPALAELGIGGDAAPLGQMLSTE